MCICICVFVLLYLYLFIHIDVFWVECVKHKSLSITWSQRVVRVWPHNMCPPITHSCPTEHCKTIFLCYSDCNTGIGFKLCNIVIWNCTISYIAEKWCIWVNWDGQWRGGRKRFTSSCPTEWAHPLRNNTKQSHKRLASRLSTKTSTKSTYICFLTAALYTSGQNISGFHRCWRQRLSLGLRMTLFLTLCLKES